MNDLLLNRERALALLAYYAPLLTPTQQKIAIAYYQCDLSLAEIAEQNGISRAAVSEALKTSVAKMEEDDTALQLVEKQGILKKRIEEALKIEDISARLEALSEIGEDIIHGI
jgi:predicted DNA-binding protein YlxM (UPF0122 family)